jgi:hypothetical protein
MASERRKELGLASVPAKKGSGREKSRATSPDTGWRGIKAAARLAQVSCQRHACDLSHFVSKSNLPTVVL